MKTGFAQKVFAIVRRIPRGKTMTYKQVAAKAGSPRAFRAVGNILNKNYDPAVPCHRVIRSDGQTGGYNRGPAFKRAKLRGEGVILVVLALLLFLPTRARAEDFTIENFESNVIIAPDSSMSVTETIQVRFLVPRHGIFRDIPLAYEGVGGKKVRLELSVTEILREGFPTQYELIHERDKLRIKIGDPDALVQEDQKYEINYRVHYGLRFFGDHDELYWNATGTEWETPVRHARATVDLGLLSLPAGTRAQTKCYTGPKGSVAEDCNIGQKFAGIYEFTANDFLTVVLGWPKGFVTEPPRPQRSWLVALWEDAIEPFLRSEYSAILMPALVLALFLLVWSRSGRDPKMKPGLPAQYDAPDKITPAELGFLMHQGYSKNALSAELVYLAEKGFLKIREVRTERRFLPDSTDYELVRLEKPGALTAYDKMLLDELFYDRTNVGSVRVSELKNKFYKHLPELKKKLWEQIKTLGYYDTNPEVARLKTRGAGFFLVFLTAVFAAVGFPALAMGSVLSGLLLFILAPLMARRTQKGVDSYQHGLGFKEYLARAETERVRWQEKENLFFEFLPYAMIFGIADKWAKAFEGIVQKPPEWYEGQRGSFSAIYFSNSLNSFSSQANSAMGSSPSSGSGLGGGGSSGGGGGGGGGGSW